jgi:MFS family permease
MGSRKHLSSNLWVLSATAFLMATGTTTWLPILPLYLRKLGAEDAQVGFAFTLMTASFAATQFLGGLVADRLGRKVAVALPTLLFSPFYALLATSNSLYEALALLVVINVISAIQSPGFVALIAESVPDDSTGNAFGFFEFALGLGYVAGPALGAWLINYVDYSYLFLGSALVSALCGVLRFILLEEPPRPQKHGQSTSWKELLSSSFLPAVFASVFISWLYNLTIWGPFLALHAKDWWGWNDAEINIAMAIGNLALAFTSIVAGKVIDQYGDALILKVSALIFPISMVVLVHSKPSVPFWALLLISFASSQLAWIAYNTFITHQSPAEYRGSFLGIIGTVSGLLGSLSPGAGGFLRGKWGSFAPFWLALICGIGLVVSVLLRKEELDTIYTVGHSNRSLEEFIALLRDHKIQVVADVRRFPYSRLNPQFNRESLEKALKAIGIEYVWLGNELGGYRTGGYEEYTKDPQFQEGLEKLEFTAFHKRTAIMCAEKLWFRCHRRFIANELVQRGWKVLHISEPGKPLSTHKLRD